METVTILSVQKMLLIKANIRILGGLAACLLAVMPLNSQADGFSLEDLDGNTHSLSDYRGKWVLVNFWATWCPPCLSEIPELTSLHNAHKGKDLIVLGIAMDSGTRFKVADFAEAHNINYPIVMGNREIAAQIGLVDALPVSFLYSPTGKLVNRHAGEVTRKSVEAYIKERKLN